MSETKITQSEAIDDTPSIHHYPSLQGFKTTTTTREDIDDTTTLFIFIFILFRYFSLNLAFI
jgi:hypothetical protein